MEIPMTEAKTESKIEFSHITLDDKALYEEYLSRESGRGCEFSFANLYLWGRQQMARIHGGIALFSQFNMRSVYPYPLGEGDKRELISAVISDSAARGIPCRITGLDECGRKNIEVLYPGKFRFHTDEGSYDYVYDINDLADLAGKKYHSKRNHIYRFADANPDCQVVPMSDENIAMAREFCAEWYKNRLSENPDADFQMEEAALERAFRDFSGLGLVGLMLVSGGEVLAMTIASRMSQDIFDVHFEKARADIQGAYAAINCHLARYIRDEYPEVKYLDREEDMGLEGLRKAKMSYHPHHRVKKYWAHLSEVGYDY